MKQPSYKHWYIQFLGRKKLFGLGLPMWLLVFLKSHLRKCSRCMSAYELDAARFHTLVCGDPVQLSGHEIRQWMGHVIQQVQKTDTGTQHRVLTGLLRGAVALTGAVILVIILVYPFSQNSRRETKPVHRFNEFMGSRGTQSTLKTVGLGISGVDDAGKEYEAVESEGVCINHALKFYLTSRDPSLRYYLLFGLQSEFTPLFYIPSPAHGEYSSMNLPHPGKNSQLLPYEIELNHRHHKGTLFMVALVTRTPLSVHTVREWVQEFAATEKPEKDAIARYLQKKVGDSGYCSVRELKIRDCRRGL